MSSYLIILLSCVGSWSYCQELSHKQYTVKDGLPGSIVYHCLQDKDGFIWFATNQGISRFDGRSFRNYSKEDGLPDNEILRLYRDRNNLIWCISLKGIPCVLDDGKIIRIDSCYGVVGIMEDQLTGSIVLLSISDGEESQFAGYYESSNIPGKWKFTRNFRQIHDMTSYTGWPILRESSTQGINFYYDYKVGHIGEVQVRTRTEEKTYVIRNTITARTGFIRPRFSTLTADKKAFIFYSSDSMYLADIHDVSGIFRLGDLGLVPVRDGDISSLYCENDTTLWICTRNKGLIRITNYLSENRTVQSFFPETFCTFIMKDEEGCYWVTTHNDGVYYLPNLDFHYLSNQAALAVKDVLCIRALDKNTLGAGFAGGDVMEINCHDLGTKLYSLWTSKNKNDRVLDILRCHDKLVIGGDGGVIQFSGQQSWRRLGTFLATKCLYSDCSDTMAMSSGAGVQLVDTRKEGGGRILSFFRSTCVKGLGKTYYWGSLNGMREFSGESIKDMGKRYPALAGVINHIDPAPDSSLWVSTQEGIVILRKGIIHRITKAQGLLSNVCKHILFDGGTAWVSSDKGLSRMDYEWTEENLRYSISGITEEDGLNSDNINQAALGGNYIWVATARGISFFSKNFVSHSFSPPGLTIDRIVAGGKAILQTDTVYLDYRNSKLLIELAGISFRSGRQVRYEYRINGIDSNWIGITNNILEFPGLPFGKFVFEARAIDRWNEKTPTPRRIVIINQAPFWKTGWFIVLTYLATAFLIGLFFYVYNREKQNRKENEYLEKKKMSDLEMMALRAQMDPHFIFNCLSSIQYHVLQADTANANLYLHKFSTLIRKILQRSAAPVISLTEEIGILRLYVELQKMRLGERMDYRIMVPDDLRYDELYIPAMIIQPYVENAIRHGISPLQDRPGMLVIGLSRSESHIECVIDDNGVGIRRSRESEKDTGSGHISMGTGNTQSRIDIYNEIHENKIRLEVRDKEDSDPQATGTIVHLSFPIITN